MSVTESSVVENFQFSLISFGDISKVVIVISVGVVQISLFRPIAEVIPTLSKFVRENGVGQLGKGFVIYEP